MRKTPTFILAVLAAAAVASAAEMAPVSVNGSATFQQDGGNWTITTATDRTAIDWTGFTVAPGATVHFQQPGASSAVLNRVIGDQITRIDGLLSSNGAVYLVNPNGIVVGPGGVVRVSSFIGSTLSVPVQQFMAGGDMNFKGDSTAVIENLGRIEAIGGEVTLIARTVVNKGSLSAPGGSVNLVAATDVLLTQDHEIYVRPQGAAITGAGVDNSGVIEAVVARLQADGNMYALAINNSGVVRATGSQAADGRVFLTGDGGSVLNGGLLAARTGATGGHIEVTGSEITVAESGVIDASGDVGGGVVLVADGRLRIDGTIRATGAAGSGGFVETSGGAVALAGMDLQIGSGGTWLLDPALMTIDAGLAAIIVGQLDAGANHQVVADQIVVAAPIVRNNANGAPVLLLKTNDAGAPLSINADIDLTSATLMLQAAGGVTQAAGTAVRAARLQLKGGGAFVLNQAMNDFGVIGALVTGVGGAIDVQDVNDLVIGNVGTAHGISAIGGEVHLYTPNGSISANGLFPAGMVMGWHALGNAEIAERSWQSESYEIRISNNPGSVGPAALEAFLRLPAGSLAALSPAEPTIEGSGVGIEFVPVAGDNLGYAWNFITRQTFNDQSPNDYAFVVVDPAGSGLPDKLADVETARRAAIQVPGLPSWQTGWASQTEELNHTDPYALSFGVMDVVDNEIESQLLIRDIFFQGGTPPGFVFVRIFDHVEDFPHLRPNQRTSTVGTEMLAPILDGVSTYFDQAAQGVDQRHFYQSVGSIYQIPR